MIKRIIFALFSGVAASIVGFSVTKNWQAWFIIIGFNLAFGFLSNHKINNE